MYSRKFSRSITRSPGSRPNPSFAITGQSTPTPTSTNPKMIRSGSSVTPQRLLFFPDDVFRSLVLPKSEEYRVAHFTCGRPFSELHFSDQLGFYPGRHGLILDAGWEGR